MRENFVSYTEKIMFSRPSIKHSSKYNTSEQTMQTFFIKNLGKSTVVVWLEVGPNGIDYICENRFSLQVDGFIALTPKIYGKYTRVGLECLEDKRTIIRINMQGKV
jgi:hypothetical protein